MHSIKVLRGDFLNVCICLYQLPSVTQERYSPREVLQPSFTLFYSLKKRIKKKLCSTFPVQTTGNVHYDVLRVLITLHHIAVHVNADCDVVLL